MKTLRTIAAVVVAFVLVFGPTVAFAATTITASPNATTYTGVATVQITGAVTPAPSSSSSSVVVTTKGPAGIVDVGPAQVATGTGAYTYTYVTGGSTGWVSGTYTVNATWGFGGVVASTTTSYTYTAATGGGGYAQMTVNIQAAALTTSTGSNVYVSVLTSSPTGTLDDVATWSPFHVHYPDGTLHNICTGPSTPAGCIGTFTRVHTGFYYVNFTLPTTALAGLYAVHAGTTDANGVTGEGMGTFVVQSATSSSSPDAAALAQISTSLTGLTTSVSGIQGSLTTLTGSINAINSGISTLTTDVTGLQTSMTGSLNTISTGVTGITNTLSGLSTNLTTVNGIGNQLTSLNNAVNNNQTYVLVVAALAAITLVLELAILVRKLS